MAGDYNEAQKLILLLREIEQRSRRQSGDSDEADDSYATWEGLVFEVAETRLVAPLGEVKEILNYPATVTRIPGTRPWVRGIANTRGNLMPVVDLQQFLGGSPIVTGKRSRVLVVDNNGIHTGLLVGRVQGMRHFDEQQYVSRHSVTGPVATYIDGEFQQENQAWPVFSVTALVASNGFQVAAA